MIDKINDDCVLVKIYDSDKIKKTSTEGGIWTTNVLKPLADSCGIGEVIVVGNKLRWIKKGDTVLYTWIAEDQPERFLGRDEDGEYRIIKDGLAHNQIYGLLKHNKKNGYSHVVPKKYYVMCQPEDDDFDLTKRIFQIPVTAINPTDDVARKMKIGIGDWIICEPYSAKSISINRTIFWFIFLETIIAVNKGQHRIGIQRLRTSQIIRGASRKELAQLN